MLLFPFVARGYIWKKQLRYFCRQISSSSEGSKIKVCIVGSGPAGFYTAQHLLKKSDIEIDIFEKLPVPFGLIRYGVAPDHPEIKVVVNAFTKTALKDQCNFFGNITVGQDVSVAELLKAYNAVVLAYGANKDRPLGVPGEDSKNVLPARKFVGWYNGLPENIDENIDLDTEVAAVIGHGNVALDVARILLRSPEELKTTDITDHALEVLKKSRIRRVVLIGRRGPLQVAFTIKELREMTKLSGCRLIMNSADFEGLDEIVSTIPRPRKRLTELMLANVTRTESRSTDKEFELRFFRSPIGIFPDANGRVEKIILGINKLDGVVDSAKVEATEEEEVLNCGLIVKSVGYQSSVIDPCVPFNQKKSVIPNEHGRVHAKHAQYSVIQIQSFQAYIAVAG